MITLTNDTKGLALLPQVEEIYGKVHTSDSLLETVLYWRINCSSVVRHLPLVLEVPGSIPARGEKNFGVRTRFL